MRDPARPYHYVRFNWWSRVDLDEVAEELGERFTVRMTKIEWDDRRISLSDEMNEELRVKADTLTAFLTPLKVVMFQNEAAPFTPRDLDLKRRMDELYRRSRPTPFPFMFGVEPGFDVAEGEPERGKE